MNETANANPKLKLQRMAKRAMSTPQDAAAAAAEKKPRTDHALSHADDSASSVSELPAVALRDSVRLTPSEAQLFEFLLAVEKHNECDAVLRVAGGWVRDKLLGRDSDDVDIALDTLKGRAFADLVNSYERDHGHVEHAVGVIKANPEQSKHLETATMQLGDPPRWVDFVNLRAETYSADADHRIPTDVQFGSPTQDAERRDFTINALFYNIGEQKVEDFTGRGVEDLRHGLIRTPLEPRVTFLDDPLRVLRAVRFAARFKFRLDDDLRAAVDHKDVRDALVRKVSRERVGKELVSMLTGSSAHPALALQLLHELRLCAPIFLPPLPDARQVFTPDNAVYELEKEEVDPRWDTGYEYAAAMYQRLVEQRNSLLGRRRASVDMDNLVEDEQQAVKARILAAFLLPYRDFTVGTRKKSQPLPIFIVLETLKLRNRDAKDVYNVILQHVTALQAQVASHEFDRVLVGLLLRSIGEQWELCFDVARVQELVDAGESDSMRSEIENRYKTFAEQVVVQGLNGVWDLRPLLNGNELVKELGIQRGPAIKQTLDKMLEWQLANPSKTRDECVAHFKSCQ